MQQHVLCELAFKKEGAGMIFIIRQQNTSYIKENIGSVASIDCQRQHTNIQIKKY